MRLRVQSRNSRKGLNIQEVRICFAALDQRERLVVKLAVLAGMRPGEIFALTWGRLNATYVDIRQRIYRGVIDTPKTTLSIRHAALPEGSSGRLKLGGQCRLLRMTTLGCFHPSG